MVDMQLYIPEDGRPEEINDESNLELDELGIPQSGMGKVTY